MAKRKRQSKKTEMLIQKTKGTVEAFQITPYNRKEGQLEDTTYEIDEINLHGGKKAFISSKQDWKANGMPKGKPAPVKVHRTLADVGKRYPRITPAFRKLK